jgi:hypothetical protein
MTPSEAARVAWREYTAALSVVAVLSGTQLDLIEGTTSTARAKFWRETWLACEREAARVAG